MVIILMVQCKTPESPKIPFSNLTQTQKDSLAEQYNNYSNYLAQPTAAHRLMKDSAILLAPENVEYRQVLSYSFKKRGDHIKAIEILNQAVELDIKKGSKDALEYQAWSLLYYYRDYEKTISNVDLINKMSKKNYNVCWGEPCGLLKGQALYKLGKYQEAIAILDTVLIVEVRLGFKAEDNYLVHFYKGRCHHVLQNYPAALASYYQVLYRDENFSEALYQIGLVYLAMNEKMKAKTYLEKAHYWVKKGKKMGEPYFERFDEVFEWQIQDALAML
jgi:tetratricopeptide (TPR) repeat protein